MGATLLSNQKMPGSTIIAGSPARIIRHRFNPAQVGAIMESRWWELDFDGARVALKKLNPEAARLGGVHK